MDGATRSTSSAVSLMHRVGARPWVALGVIAALTAGCSSTDDGVVVGSTEQAATIPAAAAESDAGTSPPVGEAAQPDGVSSVRARITSVDGQVCEVCLWLADDSSERQQGLKGVTDLGGAVGMAFAWDEPVSSRFVMIETLTPLSIAWFDAAGAHVGEADMEPCLDSDTSRCARYSPADPYVLAIEMLQGELGAVGIGPGARVELLSETEAPTCDASS